ncbi:restriction endonuclease subunit S [Lactococcus petauri]|uniref:restriction endonuclease subunit S n=1 Tax=Lactococcus petauri TaxID=1940789 RepID=UPI0022E986A5|nr:restriction endonuclease subunit S [Lactococcus petauri]
MMSKKSPQLRFEGFTDDWEERKLGDTKTHFTDGNYGESYPSAKDMSDKENGVPFLRGSDFSNGYLDSSNANYIRPEKHAELTSGHIQQDDIILAVRGSLGTLGYATQENEGWNINSQLAILRTNKSEISGKFLIQYLLGSKGQKEILSRNTGTALKQLPIKQLKDIPVPVPTLEEQQKIGSFFKQLDDTIALHQRKLDLLKEQKKGFLQKMFPKNGAKVPELRFAGFADDWEERKLGEISKYSNGGSYENDVVENGTYELITLKSVNMSGKLVSSGKFINRETKTLEKDTLVMILSEQAPGLLGMTAQIPENNKYVLNQRVAEIKPNTNIDSYFLSMSINRSQVYFSKRGAGTKVQNISKPNVENFEFYCPSEREQQKIGSFFKQLDNTIDLHQRKLDLLKEQKKGFLQKMFV